MLPRVEPTDGGDGGPRLLRGREVVRSTEADGAGVGQHSLHKVQSDPADVLVDLDQGVLTRPGGLGGVRVARVDDVRPVVLEVLAGAVADQDRTAGPEALGAGPQDDPTLGIALGAGDTHTLQNGHVAQSLSHVRFKSQTEL